MTFDYSYTSLILSIFCLVSLVGILITTATIIFAPIEIASVARRMLIIGGSICFLFLGFAVGWAVQKDCSSKSECYTLLGIIILSALGIIGLIELWAINKKNRGEWSASRHKMLHGDEAVLPDSKVMASASIIRIVIVAMLAGLPWIVTGGFLSVMAGLIIGGSLDFLLRGIINELPPLK